VRFTMATSKTLVTCWVTPEEVAQVPTLEALYDEIGDILVPLLPRQINALNRLIQAHGGTPAPDVREEDESQQFVRDVRVELRSSQR
jgi:hypothetical protein